MWDLNRNSDIMLQIVFKSQEIIIHTDQFNRVIINIYTDDLKHVSDVQGYLNIKHSDR